MTRIKNISLLIIEDNLSHAELVERVFEDISYISDIFIAHSLAEAQTILKRKRIDLVLADINLPDGRGIEIKENKEQPNLPILIMTSQGSEMMAVEAMKAGALEYIVKNNANFNNLPNMVKHALIEHINEQRIKQEEKKRIESERRYRTLLDNVKLLSVGIDAQGNINYVNPWLLKTTGYKADELLGHSWIEKLILKKKSKEISKLLIEMKHTKFAHLTYPIITKNGKQKIIAWNNTTLTDSKGQVIGFTNIGEDITDKVAAENKIRQLSKEIIQVEDNERNKLSKEIHDDIGTTIALLKMLTQSCFAKLKKGREEDIKINEEINQVLEQINQLAQSAREISHTLSPIALKAVGLPQAIRNLTEKISNSSDLNIKLNINKINNFFPENWNMNLYRIIQEGLNNIKKHANATNVEISAENHGENLHIQIKDDGIGFNAEANTQNHGIGLSIMKERAELFYGNITIKSNSPKGTSLHIIIPPIEKKA